MSTKLLPVSHDDLLASDRLLPMWMEMVAPGPKSADVCECMIQNSLALAASGTPDLRAHHVACARARLTAFGL